MSLTAVFLIAAAAVVVFIGIIEALARIGLHKGFLTTVILGKDNRTSTSKTFIFMWTLLVGWALTSLLIAGEILSIHACVIAQKAIAVCKAQGDTVGLMQIGWHNFVASGLSGSYLVLLGVPAAAGVAAKAITQSKADSGTLAKTKKDPAALARAKGAKGAKPKDGPSTTENIASRVAEIFSADDQTTDIGDLQYVIFNLITAVYFVAEFVKPSVLGLPQIPNTLLGLTGVSAALYVGKKAATSSTPKITAVFPSLLIGGSTITITGDGLTTDPTQPLPAGESPKPQVTINGKAILPASIEVDPITADRLTVTVPTGLVPAGKPTPVAGTLQVLTPYGYTTPEFDVKLG